MRMLTMFAVLVLTGCGATPVFLGDEEDGAGFFARLTEFRADVEESRILHALGAAHEVKAAGCQFSVRGVVPSGTYTTLHAGDCRAELEPSVDSESSPFSFVEDESFGATRPVARPSR